MKGAKEASAVDGLVKLAVARVLKQVVRQQGPQDHVDNQQHKHVENAQRALQNLAQHSIFQEKRKWREKKEEGEKKKRRERRNEEEEREETKKKKKTEKKQKKTKK